MEGGDRDEDRERHSRHGECKSKKIATEREKWGGGGERMRKGVGGGRMGER